MTLVLVSGVLAVGGRRRTLVLAVVLVAPALIARWFNLFWGDSVPVEFYLVPALVFIGFVMLQLIFFILRAPRVNSEVLCAGVAGYLLLGIIWMFAYILVARLQPIDPLIRKRSLRSLTTSGLRPRILCIASTPFISASSP